VIVEIELGILSLVGWLRLKCGTGMVDRAMNAEDWRPMARWWAHIGTEGHKGKSCIVFADAVSKSTGKNIGTFKIMRKSNRSRW
jgi:hypothetical protein